MSKMKIGKVEKLVLLLLKKYNMSANALSIILRATGHIRTGPSVRRAVQTLRMKGLIDNSNKLTPTGARFVRQIDDLAELNGIDPKIIDRLKVGVKGKALLYILTKIDHAALQFLSAVMKEPVKNISAVLNRLEDNGLVYGYRNMMAFTDSKGRRYRPKYYRITDAGKMVSSATSSEIGKMKNVIDEMLEYTFKLKSEMTNIHEEKCNQM